MSDFVRTHSVACSFTGSESWVILSRIEENIKHKIERIGTPLKDWDINIYRGVLTGYNDAFIITTEKKNEILMSCQSDDERIRTTELIRPILRGRDIKRYSYDWNENDPDALWLINTHNGIKGKIQPIDINDYPTIKRHLDIYWDKISIRKDKGITPYNLRNCAYMDDFFKPKIIYPNMTKFLPFVWDTKQFFTNQKCFIITGQNTAFLTAFLNSSLFKYCFRESFPELSGGTRELSKIFFDKIPVLQPDETVESKFRQLVDDIQTSYTKEKAIQIDNEIFNLYGLTEEEKVLIGFIEIH